MILEGAMVATACIALTAIHPGPVFKDFWKLDAARDSIARSEDLNLKGDGPSRG